MTITLTDISYEDAVKMRDVLTTHERFFDECPASQVDDAIQNEDDHRAERIQERLMESGGVGKRLTG